MIYQQLLFAYQQLSIYLMPANKKLHVASLSPESSCSSRGTMHGTEW